jgi:D-arabinose 1-dehydrogenase-like Zn-dependent alcohol dehydrogenase
MKGKVSVFSQIGKPLEIREVEVPDPQEGEVLVRVLRANICGSDMHMITGEAFKPFGGLFYPIVLGHEFVAKVEKIGKGVKSDYLGKSISEGDIVSVCYFKGCGRCKVCTIGKEYACFQSLASVLREAEKPPYFVGAFAEFYMVRQGQKFFKLDQDVPLNISAAINCALSQVIFGLNEIGIEYGDNVVIQGAGGLGILAAAVAKDMGAQKVIVVDAVDERLELAKSFGADFTIKLDGDFRERIAKVKEITEGGADVVVEVAGTPLAVMEGIKYMRRGGKYLIMGAINPKQKFEADPSVWIGENLTLKGVSLYHPYTILLSQNFIKRNKDKLPFDKMFYEVPFEKINDAIELAKSKKYPRIQIKVSE